MILVLRDVQRDRPWGYCPRCGGEIYGENLLCSQCREEEGQ